MIFYYLPLVLCLIILVVMTFNDYRQGLIISPKDIVFIVALSLMPVVNVVIFILMLYFAVDDITVKRNKK